MRKDTLAVIHAEFSQLPAGKMPQQGRGTGSSNTIAIRRAVKDVMAKVKRLHISAIQMTISLSDLCNEVLNEVL